MTFEMSAIHSCRLLPAGIHRVMGEGASGNGPGISREDIIRAAPRQAASIERSSRCIRASTREVAEDGMSSARKRRETLVHSVAYSGLHGVEGLQQHKLQGDDHACVHHDLTGRYLINYSFIALLVLANYHLIGIADYRNLIWSSCY
jgi:hypothetical protein